MRNRKKKSLGLALLSIAVLIVVGLFEDRLPAGVREGSLRIVPTIEEHSDEDVQAEPAANASSSSQITTSREIILTEERVQHILYGDATGGGHIYGAGKPCKSEFPKDWPVTTIVMAIMRTAANDNLDWRQEDNGYYTAEKVWEDVKMRVVLDSNKQEIITAYPINTPRNPCETNGRHKD